MINQARHNQCKRISTLITASTLMIAAAAHASTPHADTSATGTFAPTCAPYDGAAFMIMLPGSRDNTSLTLQVNAPIASALGTWPLSQNADSNSSSATYCDNGNTRACISAKSGLLTIRTPSPTRWEGTVSATFSQPGQSDTHLRLRFTATAAPQPKTRMFCG